VVLPRSRRLLTCSNTLKILLQSLSLQADIEPAEYQPGQSGNFGLSPKFIADGSKAMSNQTRHILVVDDNPSIHDDFRKVFGGLTPESSLLDHAAAELFGSGPIREKPNYRLEFASQGQEALEMVRAAIANQRPYSMAFMDVQMPPGWDGVQTMAEIWKIAPDLHIVLCTAFSNYSFEEIQNIGRTDQIVVLKKPFDAIEVLQMANVFTEKWRLLNEVKERARKLEESQHRYRFLAEATPGLLWTATAGGNVDYVNQGWTVYTGISAENSKDWSWQSAVHPEDLPSCIVAWTRALQSGENFETEYRLRHVDGAYRWHLGRARAMRNDRGDILHWVGTCTDIDDKKRAENVLIESNTSLEKRVADRTLELTKSETRYRELINGQAEGVVYSDIDTKFSFANPAAESMFGVWSGQLLGKTLYDFLDEKNKSIAKQQILLRKAGKKSTYEIEITTPRGERRQLLVTGAPQVDSTGSICGTFAILHDITQRKAAELALRESQRQLRAVLDNIPDPAWLKDSQGRYLVGNKPLARLHHRNLEDIVGKTDFNVLPGSVSNIIKTNADSVPGQAVRTEVCIREEDSRLVWFDTIETPIVNESGQLVSTVGIARDITERKQMEQALRESENRHRELLNSQRDGVGTTDAAQKFIFANPALGRILGVPAEQLIGRNLQEFLSDDQNQILNQQVELRKAGKKSSYEVQISAADGETRQVLVEAAPKLDDNGLYNGTFAVFRDITERKRTEEKLHLQTSALVATANGIVICDKSGRILWVNPAFTRLTGYEASEAIGKTPKMLRSGAHSPDFYARLWKIILDGKTWHGEIVNRRKDGSTYYEEMTITPVLDERGDITHFVAVKLDISRRKDDEEQVRAREEAFRALADNVPDAVARIDRNFRFAYGNRALAADIGMEPSEFLGKTRAELKLPLNDRWIGEVQQVVETGTPRTFEFNWQGADGICFRESRLVPEFSSTGEVEFVLAVIRDVTEQKKLQQESQLMDLQLRQAQKMEAVGQLAAGIAHEINTPTQYVGDNTQFLKDAFANLTAALKGYMDLIAAAKQNAITPELIAQAEQVLASSDFDYHIEQIPAAINETLEGVARVSKIVRAMKEFSHPGGREKSAADINRAIDSTTTVARNEWKYVADMVLDLDPNLTPVPCFLSEFNQAVLNLVVNASHAISDAIRDQKGKKGTITIRTRRDGDFAEVRVSDTGTGIPEAHRHRIFEPFFTTKDVGKGTGQGLAVVYGSIVKKHGGTVTFETETGKGTTFILRLPFGSRSPAASTSSNGANKNPEARTPKPIVSL
jgi:PAS domain S-box-containing protein